MADIDKELSPYLCAALSDAFSRDWQQSLTCTDVSLQQIPWDIEARDATGAPAFRISHTLAPWVEHRKAMAEMEDIRAALEEALAGDALRDLVVWLLLDGPPTSCRKRRRFAASLAGYVRGAAERLCNAPFGAGLDVRAMAEDIDDLRSVKLYTTLSVFQVEKIPLDGPALIVAHDTRFVRFQPPVSSVALPRVQAKLERHGELAKELILLIEAEDVDMSPESIAVLRDGLADEHRAFQAIYVCNRNHTLTYDVVRVH